MAAEEVTAQSIRSVQFREKVRGYHPVDVDAFVASVGNAFERLERALRDAESRVAELESRASLGSDAEESLTRTLVLAQRTADAAMREAREEAARLVAESQADRERARADLEELRGRLVREAHEESRLALEQLSAERAALEVELRSLHAHLERERERLRIYFADQLRRVEEGEPGFETPPSLQPDPDGEATAAPTPSPIAPGLAGSDAGDGPPPGDGADAPAPVSDGVGETEPTPAPAPEGASPSESPHWDDVLPRADAPDDDPFLTELRRAVTDEAPLGPREDEPAPPPADGDDESFDLFAKGDDEDGRFGSRLRRRR